jgi:hypothetical protein
VNFKKIRSACLLLALGVVTFASAVQADDLPLTPVPPVDPFEMIPVPAEPPGAKAMGPGCKKAYTISIFRREIDPSAPIVIRATITGVTMQDHGLRPNSEISTGAYAFVSVDEIIKGELPADVVLHEIIGGPAWTRTRNQTVMSGRL